MSAPPFSYTVRGHQLAALRTDDARFAQAMEDRDNELEDFLAARLGNGTWQAPLRIGAYYLWVDATGDLRSDSSLPTSDTDGTVVGGQS